MSSAPSPGWPPAPAGPDAAGGAHDELIVGIAAAARYLGYGKPDSFRRARTRHPIPGETRAPDGRPCWPPPAGRTSSRDRPVKQKRPVLPASLSGEGSMINGHAVW